MTKIPTTPKTSNFQPSWAFIAAAGMGSRMRPLTDDRPKPMVEVCGHPILTHIFDHLKAGGIRDIVLNTHYKRDVIEDWLHSDAVDSDLSVTAIYEPDLLDTGGGVQSAAMRLGRLDEAFVMVNGDAFWVNAQTQSTLHAMYDQWDEASMDILLLLQPVATMALTEGSGDYALASNNGADSRPVRLSAKNGDLMFAGVRIVHPRVFEGRSVGGGSIDKYSFLALMDEAEKKGRLAAHIHQGDWHHLSIPQDVKNVTAALGAGWRVGSVAPVAKSSAPHPSQTKKIRVI